MWFNNKTTDCENGEAQPVHQDNWGQLGHQGEEKSTNN